MMNKKFYTQKEVLTLLGIRQYLLRYWESEFVQISAIRDNNGSRIYSQKDIAIIQKIKVLLLDQKYSLAKAKHIVDCAFENDSDQTSFKQIKNELINIQNKITEHLSRASITN